MNPVISFEKDFANKKIVVTNQFRVPLQVVWDAFTKYTILEKWWAPKPYKTVNKEMSFEKGGRWLYYMVSPEGEKHWCIAEFLNINPLKSYTVLDAFCNQDGVIDAMHPRMTWVNTFSEENGVTTVENVLTGRDEQDVRRILEMGFEEGYKMALNQLAEIL